MDHPIEKSGFSDSPSYGQSPYMKVRDEIGINNGDEGQLFYVGPDIPGSIDYTSSSALKNKEDELARKKQELDRRELMLAEQSRQLQQYGKLANWPRCRPILYHSIEDEVVPDHQALVKRAYYHWLGGVLTLSINAITTFAILISGAQNVTTGGTDFGMGILYFLLISPLSFILWYRPLYRGFCSTSTGFMTDKSVYLLIFFVFIAFHTLFQLYMGMGIPGKGGGGLINMIAMFAAGKIWAGILLTLSTVLWLGGALLSIILIQAVAGRFRGEGYSLERARQGAQWGVFSSLFSRFG
jgi:secretory carrier-associated membrane protein